MKVLIIGGVAGGASAAARLRRLDEQSEIILFEKSGYISYANCGLPYYVGGEIAQSKSLTLQTPESFLRRFRIDARVRHEVIAINRARKTVTVRRLDDDAVFEESYDKLLLAPGARPIRPALPGLTDERVFSIRSVEDALHLRDFIDQRKPRTALVVGGGFIGLEMAENLTRQGLCVSLVEKANQVMTPLDADMAQLLHKQLLEKGVSLRLGTGLSGFDREGEGLKALLDNGEALLCDLAVLAIGVVPDTALAKDAGLALGAKDAIAVNETMQTSDPDIYAAGDAVEITNRITGQKALVPLAGPANKQGRAAADNMVGRQSVYPGAQGASILKLFGLTVAATGLNERAAKSLGIAYEAVILPAALSHAGYYPGGQNMVMKVLFKKETGRLLGAQIVGGEGTDKRIDVLATALHANLDSAELSKLDLAYAPPFSSAKDPVNTAGYIMENIRKGLVRQWHRLEEAQTDPTALLLDVRTSAEYEKGHLPASVNLPLDELREHLLTLDPSKTYYVNCQSGLRSYLACRILSQNGFSCLNLAGGYRYVELTHASLSADARPTSPCGVPVCAASAPNSTSTCAASAHDKASVCSVSAPAVCASDAPEPGSALTEADKKRVKAFGFLHCKDTNCFNGRVITRNGVLTAEELRAVTDAAARYGSGKIAMTTRLTLEVQEIPYEKIDAFREAIGRVGLMTGGTGSKVRPVVSCKGTTCQYGLIDTFALSETIHERFFLGYNGVSLPHKFKIAVGGCPNNCVKPDLNDLGIVGQCLVKLDTDKCRGCKKCGAEAACPIHSASTKNGCLHFGAQCNHCGRCAPKCPFGAVDAAQSGYKLYLGGRWGKKTACGQPMSRVFTSDAEVLDVVEKAILLYREQGVSGERFSDTIARLGFENVETQLMQDGLLARKNQILGLDVKGGATC